jgi:hypothetical protein
MCLCTLIIGESMWKIMLQLCDNFTYNPKVIIFIILNWCNPRHLRSYRVYFKIFLRFRPILPIILGLSVRTISKRFELKFSLRQLYRSVRGVKNNPVILLSSFIHIILWQRRYYMVLFSTQILNLKSPLEVPSWISWKMKILA